MILPSDQLVWSEIINIHIHVKPGAGQYPPEDQYLRLITCVCSPKILGMYLDTSFRFNTHCVQVATRVRKKNNVLKALEGTNRRQQRETLLITLGKSIVNKC